MKTLRPIYFLGCILFIVGLACSVSGGGEPAQPPQQEPPQASEATTAPAVAPTDAPPPTDTPVPTSTPEPTATAILKFFTEEFDSDPQWNYFLTYGDANKATVEFSNSRMIFTLDDLNIYAYYIFEDFEYDDVRIDIRAENRGRNNNNVSLVCRLSDEGWYEFSTEGGGVWYLYAATPGSDGSIKYTVIANGGAKSLKQGKETNEYTMICQGDEIRLLINDVEIKAVRETTFAFRAGYVGFNISSLNVVPIIVEVDWFKIGEP